jgi:hypothetical protein
VKFRTDLPESGGSKNFLKLKDKESISGIFMGDLHEFFVLWEAGKSREVPEGTPGAKFRFRINLVVKEGAVYVPKIFEQGSVVYKDLAAIHEEYPLDTIVVKITRNGTGTDTTYNLLPLLKQAITKETAAHLKTIELLPLVSNSATASAAPLGTESGDEF